MPTASPLAAPPAWDLVADTYDEAVTFETFVRQAMRIAGLPVVPYDPRNARLVDVACGPGTFAVHAAHAGYHVDAIDFSEKMIARLHDHLATERITTVTARTGDGQALPYDDGDFAGAFSMFGLMFFPDRARGFAELRRVLAPGARAVVSSWHPIESLPALGAVYRAMRDHTAGTAAPAPSVPLATIDACRTEMSDAFRGVDVHAVHHVTLYDHPRTFWATLQRSMVGVALLRERLGERWPEVDARIADTLVRELGNGPLDVTLSAWLTVGTAS